MSSTDSGPLAHTTAADVFRWGRAQPADAVMGKCMVAGECLIAEYALRVKAIAITVYPRIDLRYAHYDTARQRHALTPDLNTLALHFDRLSDHQERMHPADLDRLEATP